MPPEKLTIDYEKKLLKLIASNSRAITGVYDAAILDVSLLSTLYRTAQGEFDFSKYPSLKKAFNDIIKNMHGQIYAVTVNSIEKSWALSNEKNDRIVDGLVGDRELTKKATDLIYNHNPGALKECVKRVEKGLNLSDRVWNNVNPYKYELEAGLTDGINVGRSASEMASDLKRNLKEPERLFRRVRDENGRLKLSKAAREYKPGQGVYRSSYQNALRLTGTETNISYRSADHERWKTQPFTKGFEVKTSNNHPEYDICDQLKGNYPKDFKFTGWHPRCRCFSIPILVSDDDFDKMEDSILGIGDDAPKVDYIEKPPKGFDKYVTENKERIAGWKSKPYWINDNRQHVRT